MQVAGRADATALSLQSNLNLITKAMNKSLERMSTGYKYNHSSDGAAIYSISKQIDSQISGNTVAQSNVQQGVLVLDQVDEGLQSVTSNLNSIRDLAIKAASSTTESERETYRAEAQAYLDQINSIASTTSYNNINLLDGSVTEMNIQTGANASERFDIAAACASVAGEDLGMTTENLTEAFSTPAKANEYIATVDAAISQVSSQLGTEGSYTNILNEKLDSLATKITNYNSAFSSLMDIDTAEETSKYTQLQILQETNISLIAQLNTQNSALLSLLE